MKKQFHTFLLMLVCLFAPASFAQPFPVVEVHRNLNEINERDSVVFSKNKKQYNILNTVTVKGNTVVYVNISLPLEMRSSKLWDFWVTIQTSGLQSTEQTKRYKVNPEQLVIDDGKLNHQSTITLKNQTPDSETMVVTFLFTFIYKGAKEVKLDWPFEFDVFNDPAYKTLVINGIKNGVIYPDGKINTLSNYKRGMEPFTSEEVDKMMRDRKLLEGT